MACSCFIAFDDTLSAFATYDVLKSYGPALRNLFAATMVSTMKSARTTSCVIPNGGSVCCGAIALSTGTFRNDA